MSAEASNVWYRCRGCGRTRTLPAGLARRHVCLGCGESLWARVGSLSEQYEFLQEPDVCRIGEHRAAVVEEYRLIRPYRDRDDGEVIRVLMEEEGGEEAEEEVRVVEISIRACPQHATQLARGYHGFVLPQ